MKEWMNEWWVVKSLVYHFSSLLISFSPDLLVGKEKKFNKKQKESFFYINSFEIWSPKWILVSASRNKKDLRSEWKEDFFQKKHKQK
jgi:hypothetical protein